MNSQTPKEKTTESQVRSILHAGCPVCEGGSLTELCPFLLDQEDPQLTRFCEYRKLVLCEDCGSVSRFPLEIAPILDDRAGDYYYAQMRNRADEDPEKADPNTIAAHIDDAQSHHYDHLRDLLRARFEPSRYRRWLDVGSAGYPTAFDDYDFVTVEPSPAAVALGKQRFRSENIRLGTIESLDGDGSFDGVVFLDSFYCMTDPRRALAKARSLLRDDGILVVRMGHYFVETDSTAPDSRYDYLEPIFRGLTVSVYQNRLSLQWLCAQFGFELIEQFEHRLSNLPQKTVYFAVFRLQDRTAPVPGPSLQDAGALGKRLADGIWENFTATTVKTLREIDRCDFAIVGSTMVLRELEEIRSFEHLNVRLDTSRFLAESRQNDPARVTIDVLATMVEEGNIRDIAILDFSDPLGLVDRIREAIGEAVHFRIPTRKSGFEALHWNHAGETILTKALRLKCLKSK